MGIKNNNSECDGYVTCPCCNEEISVDWDDLCSDGLFCHKCNNPINICYDEDYDEETGDENCYWWAEKL